MRKPDAVERHDERIRSRMRNLAIAWQNSARGVEPGHGAHKYGVAKDRLSSAPFVSMVQAAHLRNGNDATVLRSIDGSRLRGVFRQG